MCVRINPIVPTEVFRASFKLRSERSGVPIDARRVLVRSRVKLFNQIVYDCCIDLNTLFKTHTTHQQPNAFFLHESKQKHHLFMYVFVVIRIRIHNAIQQRSDPSYVNAHSF